MTITHIEIEREVNSHKHGRVTVHYSDGKTAKFYIGRHVSEERARTLARDRRVTGRG